MRQRARRQASEGSHGPDNFCWYCGLPLQYEDRTRGDYATVDHVVARARGGRGSGNYVHACKACNGRKKDFSLSYFRYRHGGGVFWGEMFHPQYVQKSGIRPMDLTAFRAWYAQVTLNPTDHSWMKGRTTIEKLRSITRDLEGPSKVKRPLTRLGIRMELGSKAKRVTIYVPWRVVVVGKFFAPSKRGPHDDG